MSEEVFGKPVRIIAPDGKAIVPFGMSTELCRNHGNKVKLLDNGRDCVILVNPDVEVYDASFPIIKLIRVNSYSVTLWRLCRDNFLTTGDYLYAFRVPYGVLITISPTLPASWLPKGEK